MRPFQADTADLSGVHRVPDPDLPVPQPSHKPIHIESWNICSPADAEYHKIPLLSEFFYTPGPISVSWLAFVVVIVPGPHSWDDSSAPAVDSAGVSVSAGVITGPADGGIS